MKKFDTLSDKIIMAIVYIFITALVIVTIYPFWNVIILSVSPPKEALLGGFRFITLNPTFDAYRQVLASTEIWRSFYNSAFRVIVGTVCSVFFTTLMAYPLSKNYLPFNKFFTGMVILTMMFSGGMIPSYLLIKGLGLTDSIFSLILPTTISAYNLIIMRNFLRELPQSLEESAKIDGATDFQIWYKIILPLSKPVIATVALWVAVAHWNAYMDALIYITDRSKYVLSIVVRRMLLENQMDMFVVGTETGAKPTGESIKSVVIIISSLPVMLLYPFLQKYFTKGIMLGAVKG